MLNLLFNLLLSFAQAQGFAFAECGIYDVQGVLNKDQCLVINQGARSQYSVCFRTTDDLKGYGTIPIWATVAVEKAGQKFSVQAKMIKLEGVLPHAKAPVEQILLRQKKDCAN